MAKNARDDEGGGCFGTSVVGLIYCLSLIVSAREETADFEIHCPLITFRLFLSNNWSHWQ